MRTKMYKNNVELWKSIDTDNHFYNEANKIKDFTLKNISKITHINGIEVKNVKNIDESTLEYSFKGSVKLEYSSIILNNITFINS